MDADMRPVAERPAASHARVRARDISGGLIGGIAGEVNVIRGNRARAAEEAKQRVTVNFTNNGVMPTASDANQWLRDGIDKGVTGMASHASYGY